MLLLLLLTALGPTPLGYGPEANAPTPTQTGAFGQASATSAAEDSVAAAAHAALREGEVVVARTDSPIPIERMPLSPSRSPIAFRRTLDSL